MKKVILIGNTLLLTLILSSYKQVNQDKWIAPEESKSLNNQVEKNEQSVLAGKKIFDQLCWSCHGNSGTGDGPAGRALRTKPADFSNELFQIQTDGEIFWKISEGRNDMTGYKYSLSEEYRWQLVHFLRTFK